MMSVDGPKQVANTPRSGVSMHGCHGAVCEEEAEAPGRLRTSAGEAGDCDSSVLAGNDTTLRPHDDRCMLALERGNQVGGDE